MKKSYILPSTVSISAQTNGVELMLTDKRLEGKLNENFVLTDSEGSYYIWRKKKKTSIPPIIPEELQAIGFFENGGNFHLRDISEQVFFMNRAKKAGLKTIAPLFVTEEGILLPFIHGITLDEYLKNGKTSLVVPILNNLTKAHKQDIIYGDRWTTNTMIDLDEGFTEVDFDVALEGPGAKEFDLVQFISYVFYFSSEKATLLQLLQNHFRKKNILAPYNKNLIETFLGNYPLFYKEKTGKDISELLILRDFLMKL